MRYRLVLYTAIVYKKFSSEVLLKRSRLAHTIVWLLVLATMIFIYCSYYCGCENVGVGHGRLGPPSRAGLVKLSITNQAMDWSEIAVARSSFHAICIFVYIYTSFNVSCSSWNGIITNAIAFVAKKTKTALL